MTAWLVFRKRVGFAPHVAAASSWIHQDPHGGKPKTKTHVWRPGSGRDMAGSGHKHSSESEYSQHKHELLFLSNTAPDTHIVQSLHAGIPLATTATVSAPHTSITITSVQYGAVHVLLYCLERCVRTLNTVRWRS